MSHPRIDAASTLPHWTSRRLDLGFALRTLQIAIPIGSSLLRVSGDIAPSEQSYQAMAD